MVKTIGNIVNNSESMEVMLRMLNIEFSKFNNSIKKFYNQKNDIDKKDVMMNVFVMLINIHKYMMVLQFMNLENNYDLEALEVKKGFCTFMLTEILKENNVNINIMAIIQEFIFSNDEINTKMVEKHFNKITNSKGCNCSKNEGDK